MERATCKLSYVTMGQPRGQETMCPLPDGQRSPRVGISKRENDVLFFFFLITQFQKQHNKDDHILHIQGSSSQGRQYQQARNLESILEDPAPAANFSLLLGDLTEAEADRNANPVSNTRFWQNLKHCPAQPTVGFSLIDSLPWHPCQIHIMFFTPQIDYYLYIG